MRGYLWEQHFFHWSPYFYPAISRGGSLQMCIRDSLNAMKPALSPKETRTTTSFFRLTTSITFRTIINAIIIPPVSYTHLDVYKRQLLTKLQDNSFGFAPENINAVKDAICLSSSDAGTFYGLSLIHI